MGTFEQLSGFMLNAGWVSTFTEDDFEEFLQAHEEEIKRRAATIRMSAG
jgi:hypothetical protein